MNDLDRIERRQYLFRFVDRAARRDGDHVLNFRVCVFKFSDRIGHRRQDSFQLLSPAAGQKRNDRLRGIQIELPAKLIAPDPRRHFAGQRMPDELDMIHAARLVPLGFERKDRQQ